MHFFSRTDARWLKDPSPGFARSYLVPRAVERWQQSVRYSFIPLQLRWLDPSGFEKAAYSIEGRLDVLEFNEMH
jgi:hypothetical protein